jgi:hypothetical protein
LPEKCQIFLLNVLQNSVFASPVPHFEVDGDSHPSVDVSAPGVGTADAQVATPVTESQKLACSAINEILGRAGSGGSDKGVKGEEAIISLSPTSSSTSTKETAKLISTWLSEGLLDDDDDEEREVGLLYQLLQPCNTEWWRLQSNETIQLHCALISAVSCNYGELLW